MSTTESTANKGNTTSKRTRGGMDRLLTVQNAKTTKGEKLGILTGILYLAPANEVGRDEHLRIFHSRMPACLSLYCWPRRF